VEAAGDEGGVAIEVAQEHDEEVDRAALAAFGLGPGRDPGTRVPDIKSR
jgi:hypothetical protein